MNKATAHQSKADVASRDREREREKFKGMFLSISEHDNKIIQFYLKKKFKHPKREKGFKSLTKFHQFRNLKITFDPSP